MYENDITPSSSLHAKQISAPNLDQTCWIGILAYVHLTKEITEESQFRAPATWSPHGEVHNKEDHFLLSLREPMYQSMAETD